MERPRFLTARATAIAIVIGSALVLTGIALPTSSSSGRAQAPGGKMLFESGGNGVIPRWYIVRANGADRRAFRSEGWARLSPDGRRLAFSCPPNLCVSAADGTNRRVVATPSASGRVLIESGTIAWSPEGRRIAFSSPQGVWTVAADGSASRLIIRLPKVTATALSWSPTGGSIAFARNLAVAGHPNLAQLVPGPVYLVNADGSRPRRLARFCRSFDALSWSPDGRSLVWAVGRGAAPTRIVTTDVVTGKSTLLAKGDRPMFSPDGHKIAFERLVRGTLKVAVMGSDGSHLRPLGFGYAPVWAPDGLRLGFGSGGLMVMGADGTRRRIVATVPGDIGALQWTRG